LGHLSPDITKPTQRFLFSQFVEITDAEGTHQEMPEPLLEAAWNKLNGYAARLALVAQLASDPQSKTITGDTMRAACDFCQWAGREAERIYATLSETVAECEQRQLIEFIDRRGGVVTVRDVMQSYRPLKNKKDEAERALHALVKNGLAEKKETQPEGPGRPTVKFQILPPWSTSTEFIDVNAVQNTPMSTVFPRGETPNCVDSVNAETRTNNTVDVDTPLPFTGIWRPCWTCLKRSPKRACFRKDILTASGDTNRTRGKVSTAVMTAAYLPHYPKSTPEDIDLFDNEKDEFEDEPNEEDLDDVDDDLEAWGSQLADL